MTEQNWTMMATSHTAAAAQSRIRQPRDEELERILDQQHHHNVDGEEEEGDDEDTQKHRRTFATILETSDQPLFRPGGNAGLHQIHDWSGLNVGDYLLELGSEVGRTSGMVLAHRFGCHVTLTNNDPSHFAMAYQFAQQQGLADEQWETKCMKMTDVDALLERNYDCTLIEQAALSHVSNHDKITIIQGLANHTKQILLHEYCILGADFDDAVVQRVQTDLSKVMGQDMHLLTEGDWKQLLLDANFHVTQFETGPVKLFHPKAMLQEEGFEGINNALHTVWNLATHNELRVRMLEFQDFLEEHKDNIGYCLIQAVKHK